VIDDGKCILNGMPWRQRVYSKLSEILDPPGLTPLGQDKAGGVGANGRIGQWAGEQTGGPLGTGLAG